MTCAPVFFYFFLFYFYLFFILTKRLFDENAVRNIQSYIKFPLVVDAIDAAPEWSLPMRLEERDDGRVAFAFCDGQWRVPILRCPIDLRAVVQ